MLERLHLGNIPERRIIQAAIEYSVIGGMALLLTPNVTVAAPILFVFAVRVLGYQESHRFDTRTEAGIAALFGILLYILAAI